MGCGCPSAASIVDGWRSLAPPGGQAGAASGATILGTGCKARAGCTDLGCGCEGGDDPAFGGADPRLPAGGSWSVACFRSEYNLLYTPKPVTLPEKAYECDWPWRNALAACARDDSDRASLHFGSNDGGDILSTWDTIAQGVAEGVVLLRSPGWIGFDVNDCGLPPGACHDCHWPDGDRVVFFAGGRRGADVRPLYPPFPLYTGSGTGAIFDGLDDSALVARAKRVLESDHVTVDSSLGAVLYAMLRLAWAYLIEEFSVLQWAICTTRGTSEDALEEKLWTILTTGRDEAGRGLYVTASPNAEGTDLLYTSHVGPASTLVYLNVADRAPVMRALRELYNRANDNRHLGDKDAVVRTIASALMRALIYWATGGETVRDLRRTLGQCDDASWPLRASNSWLWYVNMRRPFLSTQLALEETAADCVGSYGKIQFDTDRESFHANMCLLNSNYIHVVPIVCEGDEYSTTGFCGLTEDVDQKYGLNARTEVDNGLCYLASIRRWPQ